MATIRVLESDRGHAFGVLPGVMLYVWRASPSVAAARALAGGLEQIRNDGLPPILLGVVEAGTPPPESDARKALAESMKSGGPFLRASALAFEGEGFQASMVRAVATGLALISRVPYPHQVFASVPLAAEWLARSAPEHTAAKLIASLQELRAAPIA